MRPGRRRAPGAAWLARIVCTSSVALALDAVGCASNGSTPTVASDAAADGTVAPEASVFADAAHDASGNGDANGAADANDSRDAKGGGDAVGPGPAVHAEAGPAGDFTVNLGSAVGTVTRLIYGHNWLTPAQMTWRTVGRFGGNPLSVFNWRQDFYNSGSDYFFENLAMPWSNYAKWEDFVGAGSQTGATLLIVVPTLGWVARGPSKACSYPFSRLPHQQDYEHTYNPDGGSGLSCALDPAAGDGCCGNGNAPGGAPIDAAVPLDASYDPSSPADVVAWLQAIHGQLGDAAFSNVLVGLDNEPDWWNTTHRDVHPTAATIDEIWHVNQTYAAAIKAAFPGTPILGPDLVSWWNTADVTTYLADVAAYRVAHGVQLVDYLDLHFYPGWGTFSFACDAIPAAQRLQAPRLLWDPTYANPYDGIVTEPARVIPRYKEMIASTNAGVKLALSEYNFGTDSCAAGAVAQAEALAVFGRYGLDLATRWSDSGYAGHYALTAGSPAESAFRMFLDHDVTGTSVEVVTAAGAETSAPLGAANVTVYAVLNGSTLNVLLFNKQASPASISVQLGDAAVTSVTAYELSVASPALAAASAPPVAAGVAAVTLPAMSATLLVATLP